MQRGGDFRGRGRGGPGRGGGDRGGGPPFRGGDRGGFRGRGRGGPTGPVIFEPSTPGNADPSLASAGDRLVASFKSLRLKGGNDIDDLPLRPDYGKLGRPIQVRANHFAIRIPKGPLFEYRISFQPEVKIKRVRKRLLEILESAPQFQPYKNFVAHDSSEKLIAARKLPSPDGRSLDITVRLFDEDESGPDAKSKSFTISLDFTNEISSDNLNNYLNGRDREFNIAPLLSALNIILAKHPSGAGKGVRVGRDRFFFKAGQSFNLGAGLEAWKGFYSSVRPTVNTLLVNVNVCYTAFYKEGNLARAVEEFQRGSFGGRPDDFVKGIRVTPTHLNYRPKKTVRRVCPQSALNIRFHCEELGGPVTVADYFRRKYKKNLQKPNLVVDLGTKEKPNLVPAELCEILPNQPFRGKLSDTNTAEMIKYACNPPAQNARSIVDQGLAALGFTGSATQSLNAFGVGVIPEMVIIPARVLDPPQLKYAGNQTADINRDKASWNLQNRKFFKGQRVANWMLAVVRMTEHDFSSPTDPVLQELIAAFQSSCIAAGMSIGPPAKLIPCDIRKSSDLYNTLGPVLSAAKGASFLLVILSGADKRVYGTIRRICDITLGIPATCTQSAKIRKAQPQYMANVALKINAKLGGVNHALDVNHSRWLASKVTMLVGMDVTHPGPGSLKGTPSIAGVVASYDADHALYPASLRLQESKKEMIVELAQMMVERLQLFKQKRNRLPERIIVFRDGVSEGQFITVLREEYPKFLESFRRIAGNGPAYRPKLTIIICGKRHHTRFYPKTPDGADFLGNPKPGTVVDRGVTAIYEFDFFLQAHGGLQGSTRPTHYTVVHDENDFNADAAQGLINYSSYMYARATRAVSLVPPAYYADLVCERGRYYIHDLLNATSGGSISGGSGSEDEVYKQAQKMWGNGIHPNVASSMFYL